jgi:ribosomal subunit interface protein
MYKGYSFIAFNVHNSHICADVILKTSILTTSYLTRRRIMEFILTARHFKAHDSIKEFAQKQTEKIRKYYDGILKTEIILSYEKPLKSVKIAEVIATATPHHIFTAREHSEDFNVSIEAAVNKVIAQIKKYKDKLKSNHTGKNHSGKVIDHLIDGEQ